MLRSCCRLRWARWGADQQQTRQVAAANARQHLDGTGQPDGTVEPPRRPRPMTRRPGRGPGGIAALAADSADSQDSWFTAHIPNFRQRGQDIRFEHRGRRVSGTQVERFRFRAGSTLRRFPENTGKGGENIPQQNPEAWTDPAHTGGEKKGRQTQAQKAAIA